MPRVRVFVPTFRRPALLIRAVESLRAQTMTDWICELHNDDPADPAPAELVRRLADPRIQFFQHEKNLGATATFNLFYRATPESFYSLLEDDNWWEPAFLETLLDALERHPDVTLAWCNQRLWQEQPDRSWCDTGRFVQEIQATAHPFELIRWGDWRQIAGARHSHGAMLVRSRNDDAYPTPQIPVAGVEPFRERLFPHPLLFVAAPLANFSLTLETARSRDHGEWGALLVALAATWLRHARLDRPQQNACWKYFRDQHPPMTNALIAAALASPDLRSLLTHARPIDWFRYAKSCLRHPISEWRSVHVRTRHPDWWHPLDQATARRFAEATPLHSTTVATPSSR